MASDMRHRSGQAMTEFALILLAMILVVLVLVEFLPIFLDNFGLLKEVREEAGKDALSSASGIAKADRQQEFSVERLNDLLDESATSGYLAEKLSLPAANLACNEAVNIPNIAGVIETMHCKSRDGTSEFLSGMTSAGPTAALMTAKGAFVGAGWNVQPIEAYDTLVFTHGDRAIAAVHVGFNGVITVIARTAGSEM